MSDESETIESLLFSGMEKNDKSSKVSNNKISNDKEKKSTSKKTPKTTPRAIPAVVSTLPTTTPVISKLNFDAVQSMIENHVSSRTNKSPKTPNIENFDDNDSKTKLGDRLRELYSNFHDKIKKKKIRMKINQIETDATRLARIGKEEMIFYQPLSPSLLRELEKEGLKYDPDPKTGQYKLTWSY